MSVDVRWHVGNTVSADDLLLSVFHRKPMPMAACDPKHSFKRKLSCRLVREVVMSQIRRRQFLVAAGALLAAPLGADAQQATKVPRIGVLMPSTPTAVVNLIEAFEHGLREHGYVEGQNIVLVYRYSGAGIERARELAAELVSAKVTVIVTTTDAVARTVKQHTQAIPIVMVNSSDPVGSGLVKTLAHPGANITGVTNFSPEISGKRIQLLKESVPILSRVAYLWNRDVAGASDVYREIETAARRLSMEIQSVEVHRTEDIDGAFAALVKGGNMGLLVQAPNPVLYTNRIQISNLANARHLPSMFNRVEYVSAGGLMSYGPNVSDMYRRAAAYVDKILKGAKPADLPVEQPTKFELVINLKTAKALGLTIPPSILLRADRVIE